MLPRRIHLQGAFLLDEIELINGIERIEELIAKGSSQDQKRLLMTVIRKMRANLDELYDREYIIQIHRKPDLLGQIFPQLSTSGRT